jgi:L-threonylcarbamoyladenylate synthase
MPLILTVDPRLPDDRLLGQAAEFVRNGGVIVYPTETIYGIGSSAHSGDAIRRIQSLKRRTVQKPLLLLIRGVDQLPPLVRDVGDDARRLMAAFWPGPLTIILPAAEGLPAELTQGRGTIGIRIPSSPLCLRLIELAGAPLTSTSANLSGEAPLNSIAEMLSVLPEGVDCFLDAGPLHPSPPSSVVDLSGPIPVMVREGAIPADSLAKLLPVLAR